MMKRSCLVLLIEAMLAASLVSRTAIAQDLETVAHGEVRELIAGIPLPPALSVNAVFVSATDVIHGTGFETTVTMLPHWFRIVSWEHISGVGRAMTSITFDDGERQTRYDIAKSQAIILGSALHAAVPVGISFQVTPGAWSPFLAAISDGRSPYEAQRVDGEIVIASGPYRVRVNETTREITGAEIVSGGLVTAIWYNEWSPVEALGGERYRHPTRLSSAVIAGGVETVRREFRLHDVRVLDSGLAPEPPSFTASTLVMDQTTGEAYKGDGTPIKLGDPVQVPGLFSRSPSLSHLMALLGALCLLIAGIVVLRRRAASPV